MFAHKFIGTILLVYGLLVTTAGYADGFISDGHGGYCTDFGTPSSERPKCTKAQHDAAYKQPVGNAADQFLARNDQVLRKPANWFLQQAGLKTLPCERVAAVVGGDLEEPFIAAIACDNANGRVLYEVLNHAYSPDQHGHARIATPEQIDTDIYALSKGMGIAGTWWKR